MGMRFSWVERKDGVEDMAWQLKIWKSKGVGRVSWRSDRGVFGEPTGWQKVIVGNVGGWRGERMANDDWVGQEEFE